MAPMRNKTGDYLLVKECIEAIVGYFESAFFLGFDDGNVWRGLMSDGVPVDPVRPEDVYKVDSADLVTIIHYLIDHRQRLDTALELFKESLEAGDDLHAARRLYLDVIEAARENRPGPFSRDET